MSGKIALDTDVAIKFLNGNAQIAEILLNHSEICMPAIVAGELIFGALNSKHSDQNLAKHKKLIQRTRLLTVGEATAITYAKTRLSLKKKGRPIPENDLWIAALCIENKIPLFSNDAHFEDIEHLSILQPE